ncbi:polymerase [Crowned shrew hepatitis B virus]|uniref:Protein P n=1 Tax=Crowned shrew hepatitis B virus TaxID=2596879 RepID=A0A516RTP3_9HEPA|nr:polymerase [Crowned shrew hepatitis B virus]
MHPFSQLFRKLAISEEEPPEVLLQHLADADLNHQVKEDLLLPLRSDIPWTHKVNDLLGLYHQKTYNYNPNWTLPDFSGIHLIANLIEHIEKYFGPLTPGEKRRLKLISPARFFPNKTKYLPLVRAIKGHYPEYILHHQIKASAYLWNLYEAGILYLRESQHTASFIGQVYPWEHRLQHGQQLVPRGQLWLHGFHPSGSGNSQLVISKASPSQRGLDSDPSGGYKCHRGKSSPSLLQDSTRFTTSARYKTHPATAHAQRPPRQRSAFSVQRGTSGERTGEKPGGDSQCPIRLLSQSSACGQYCLSLLFSLGTDWGPCPGEHEQRICIKIPGTPRRVTGGVFLVDKNPRNTAEARLVVDFSQFSRGDTRVRWPRFAVPNLQALTNILPPNLQWLSLDVSAAFYHIALSPAAMPHLLVGVPGLFGNDTCVPFRTHGKQYHHTMQELHRHCNRPNYETLMLLYKDIGRRKLHLCTHSSVLGFRKIPMGVGLSPFLLAQFTTAIVSVVRRNFPHCFAFAYMDDVVLGAKHLHHLESVYTAVLNFLVSLGIKINPEKTKWWGFNLQFMGLVLSPSGTLPQTQHHERALTLLKSMPVRRPIDYKIIQRLLGILSYVAPFTPFGWALLMPMYQVKQAFVFSLEYKQMLLENYRTLYPVLPQHCVTSYVYSDATPSSWGYCSPFEHNAGTFDNDLPIFVAETIAAALAHIHTGAQLIGVDNSGVCSHKFTHLPWLLGCYMTWILRRVRFVYVPSNLNPADSVSRLWGLRRGPLHRLHLCPARGRIALYADSPPALPRLQARVSFASPLENWDNWINHGMLS